jgi:CheY-like chemotaxis protein
LPCGGVKEKNMNPQRCFLVVDDNADTAEALAAWLRLTTGARVVTATDGAEAIELTIDNRPQAIVMDIGMPGVGGIDAVHVLRRLFKDRPPRLIALTGLAGDHRERILAAGFDAYLGKPVDLDRLLEILEAAEPRLAA